MGTSVQATVRVEGTVWSLQPTRAQWSPGAARQDQNSVFLSKAKPAALQHSGDELVSREMQTISRSCRIRDSGIGRHP